MNFGDKVIFIWSVADLLRGPTIPGPVADRCDCFPEKNLVRLSPVALGGVKERDTQIDC